MRRAIKRVGFPTAQDAEAAFYEAIEHGDLETMMEVWAEDEEVVCVHPGGTRITGYEKVRESWAELFGAGERVRVHLSNQVYMQGMLLAVHSVHENLLYEGEPKARPPIVATNVYMRTSDGWRMLMHHASPSPQHPATVGDILKRLH